MFEWLGPCCIKRISWPPLFLLVVLLLNFSKMFKGSFFYLCIDRAVCSSSKRRKTRIPLISICRIRFLVLTTHTVCILCMYSSSRKDEISVFNSKISTVGGTMCVGEWQGIEFSHLYEITPCITHHIQSPSKYNNFTYLNYKKLGKKEDKVYHVW